MKHIRVLSLLLVMLILASCTAESISGGNVTAIGTGTEQTTKSDVQENGADFTKETEEKQEMTEKTTPEKEGLSSEGIAAMMDGLKKAQLAMHSVLIMRHGEIVAGTPNRLTRIPCIECIRSARVLWELLSASWNPKGRFQ